jgi:hypothetical protein
MSQSKKVSFLRGKRLRATALDVSGVPFYGESSVVVTKGVVTLTYTTNTDAGNPISVPNMNGEACINETAVPTLTGYGVEADFCDVDFALLELLTGQKVYVDDNGLVIGITESTGVDMAAVNFALEMWLGSSNPGEYGYVLTPFLSGGVVSDIAVANDAITFKVTGMQTKNGTGWGKGPYKVEKVGGVDSVMREAMNANDHRRIFTTTVAPPAIYAGSTPLLDSADPAVTSLTATATGKSVAIAPTPAGTDPMWYDFGDGTWDYAETGSYTHVYATAGTFTITGHRGSTTATATVTTT